MQFPYSITDRTFTVYIDGKAYQTDRGNPNWLRIKELIAEDNPDPDTLIWLVQPINAVQAALADAKSIQILNGVVYHGRDPIHNALSSRMLDVLNEGLPIEPWVKFAENVYANPAPFARDELYLFLEAADLPITPDGCFIAYKIVREDYMDEYSGRMDNSVGNLVVMPGGRDAVDPVRDRTCSYGLHFCSKPYLPYYGSGGSRVMLVKINPADVVSIPSDYGNAKGRTWRYEVVGEIDREEAGLAKWAPIEASYGDYSWGWSEADEDVDFEDDDDDYFVDPRVRQVTEDEIAEIQANVFTPLDLGIDTDDAEDAAVFAEAMQDDPEDVPFFDIFSNPPVHVPGDPDGIVIQDAEPEDEPVIESVAHGRITRALFTEMREQFGSLNAMAKNLGISAGTVQAWKTKLFGRANG